MPPPFVGGAKGGALFFSFPFIARGAFPPPFTFSLLETFSMFAELMIKLING